MKSKAIWVCLVIGAFLFPPSVQADVVDVFYFKLKDGATIEQWLEVANDWKKAADKAGVDYQLELVTPIFTANPGVYASVGRSPNLETHGKAWNWYQENGAEFARRWSELSENVSTGMGTSVRVR